MQQSVLWSLLKPFSRFYGLAVSARNALYDKRILKTKKPGCVIISVGNITWGGTGKTPFAAMLARELIRKKRKVAVLTRGYGGDEAQMLKEELPEAAIITGSDRLKAAREAIGSYGADTIILDDGFQRRQIGRDLDILLIDSTNPFGNGSLIPEGILREPPSAIKRADIILLTKTDLAKDTLPDLEARIKKINPAALTAEAIHHPVALCRFDNNMNIPLTDIINKRVCLLSAIGSRQSFRKTADLLQAKAILDFAFRDHHVYALGDMQKVFKACRTNGAEAIITTHKDALRLRQPHIRDFVVRGAKNANVKIFVLKIELRITRNKEEFFERVYSLYNS